MLSLSLCTVGAIGGTFDSVFISVASTNGHAIKRLITETVRGIEIGHETSVISELNRIQQIYQSTQGNNADIIPLVDTAVHRLREVNSGIPIQEDLENPAPLRH